jgi:hypothetical protein
VDQNQATGWSTNIDAGLQGAPSGAFHPKSMVVNLGTPYDVTGFGVDPAASCGDGASASTAGYQILTSPSGVGPWTEAAAGTFTNADDGRINSLASNDGGAPVQFVKLVMKSNQTPDFGHTCPGGAFSGCQYVDLTELQVYGTPAP